MCREAAGARARPAPGVGIRPRDRSARPPAVGLVGAVRAGPHGPVEVAAELRVVIADAADRLADALLHRDPRALGRRGRTARPAAQPERSGQVTAQGVGLAAQARRASGVLEALGLLQLAL